MKGVDLTKYEPGLRGDHLLPRDVHALLYRHGWMEPLNMARMVANVQAESQFWTEAVGTINPDGSQDFGLFQLNDSHWSRFAASRDAFVKLAFVPDEAAAIARALWHDDQKAGGSGFKPWAAFNSGAYEQYLPGACRALCNFAAVTLIGKPVI